MSDDGGESLTTFRMKQSAARQANKTFQEYIRKQMITIDDAYEMLGMFFMNPDVIQSWTELLTKKYKDYDVALNNKERLNFIADATSEFAQSRERLDPTSRLLLIGASPSLSGEKTFWNLKFPDCLVQNFKHPGTYGCIEGVPRSGKTSLAVSFMKVITDTTKLEILTNIAIRDAPDKIHYTPTLSNLVTEMAEWSGWVCILDETGAFVGRKRALSSENVDFENLGRFIGKLGGRLIMITHDMNRDVPTILQTWMSETYRKLSLTDAWVSLQRQGGLNMRRAITSIPDAEMDYMTEDITSLQFDISIKKLLSDIQHTKKFGKEEQKKAVIEWIEENKKRISSSQVMDRATIAYNKVSELIKKGVPKMTAYMDVGKEMNLTGHTIRQYHTFIKKAEEERTKQIEDDADDT